MKKISYLAIAALTAASLSTLTNTALAKSSKRAAPPKVARAATPKPPAAVVVSPPAPPASPRIEMPKITPAPAPKPAPLPNHVAKLKSPVVAKAATSSPKATTSSTSSFTYIPPVATPKKEVTPSPTYNVPSSSKANNAIANLASSMKGLTADQAERKFNDAKAKPVTNPNLSTKTGPTVIKESSTEKKTIHPSIFTNNGTKTTTTNDGNKIITTTETSTTETKRTSLSTTIDRIATTNYSLSSLNGKASQKNIIDVANKFGTLQTTALNSANAKMKYDSTKKVDAKAYEADLKKRINEAQKTGNTVFLLQSFASPEGKSKHNQDLSDRRAKEDLARDINILIKDGWKCTSSCGTGKDGKDKDGKVTYEKNGKIISYISIGMGEVLPKDPVLGAQYDKAVKACSSGSASKCEAALSPMRTTLTTAINPKDLIKKETLGSDKDTSTENTFTTTTTVETPLPTPRPSSSPSGLPTPKPSPSTSTPTTTPTRTPEPTPSSTSTPTTTPTRTPTRTPEPTPSSTSTSASTIPEACPTTGPIPPRCIGRVGSTGTGTTGTGSTGTGTTGTGTTGPGVGVPAGSSLTPPSGSSSAPKPPFKIS